MNEKIKNYREISKNGIIENAKSIIINKFGFMPQHKRMNSESANNSHLLLSKSSLNNSKNKSNNSKLKLSILGNNKKLINLKKNSQSCKSLLDNEPVTKNKKLSRNYNQYSSITNENTNTNSKYYSSFFNSKPKILNSLQKNINYSYSITNYNNNHEKVKKISFDDKSKNIKSYVNKPKTKFNEIVLNVKPIIKKNENIIHNQIWSKLITSIDQKQNDKINKFKNKCLNKVNININANININIKKNIINYQKVIIMIMF